MIPAWLQRHLETAGRWNVDGIGRRLSGGRCRRCHATVVRALDDDIAGLPVTCDAQPVNDVGEALALLQGRATYAVVNSLGRWQLDPRDRYRIAARRPDLVVAQHVCDVPALPAADVAAPAVALPSSEECPF